jgi:hypothetical protein
MGRDFAMIDPRLIARLITEDPDIFNDDNDDISKSKEMIYNLHRQGSGILATIEPYEDQFICKLTLPRYSDTIEGLGSTRVDAILNAVHDLQKLNTQLFKKVQPALDKALGRTESDDNETLDISDLNQESLRHAKKCVEYGKGAPNLGRGWGYSEFNGEPATVKNYPTPRGFVDDDYIDETEVVFGLRRDESGGYKTNDVLYFGDSAYVTFSVDFTNGPSEWRSVPTGSRRVSADEWEAVERDVELPEPIIFIKSISINTLASGVALKVSPEMEAFLYGSALLEIEEAVEEMVNERLAGHDFDEF